MPAILSTALLLTLALSTAQAETVGPISPLAQSFYPAEDDDRPELFLPEPGDSDASNFEPTEGDSDPDNFDSSDLYEPSLPVLTPGRAQA